ncbi:hypothetical protein HRbin17_00202 [bacterium HR17]|uniref:DUF3054 domain-containing protein n=1 Tax=Candidatus Fervidibacter japonicus TaxID=2035412 RepID=A0A2H5X944_9BACT|nr:hypothetical protein HRbin17_00202 [bacterium HR17]
MRWTTTATLVLGDAVMFGLFALVGVAHHKQPVTFGRLWHAALPFAIAWFALAPALGAFRAPVVNEPRQALRRIPVCWLVCGLIGLAVRYGLWGRPPVLSFALVALTSMGLLLTAWRMAFAFWQTTCRTAHQRL